MNGTELDFLKILTPREEKIIKMRYGVDRPEWGFSDGRSHTLAEIGQSFRMTRERVRQIEAKALRKLRRWRKMRKLRQAQELVRGTR